jgi:hypothetical protein
MKGVPVRYRPDVIVEHGAAIVKSVLLDRSRDEHNLQADGKQLAANIFICLTHASN